ncbi:MAG TPA: efflux RND transporter periplasmic adaptor subunit [Pseudolabrys sp.]|uniref:efflux RND transporter periplasmic adaptor subunit n=1 Tax=Pseudolabrys sp. TaxID=1960880 RepID=UPI002DDC90FE|nr:efflux RND transporter periplasmic adaptor subunit [Pseudolabrys sp.]HEV2629674.1 efflux RND transporter periplasmic adaptor subunit [Pseudolabrys sp.]
MHGELPKQKLKTKPASGLRRGLTILVVLVAVGAALGYVFFGMQAPQQKPGGRAARFAASGPVPVLVAAAASADVPVYLNAVGTTKAYNTVTLHSQVDGKLIAVNFNEGQDVKKGDILAQIDPTTFKATLDQAVAKKAQDAALLANTKVDLVRYEQLAATNAINRQQADTQRALVAQYTAQVQSDQAAVESAQATLGYTDIRAPIDGRTGIRQVDVGNIIHASDSSGIVVITQIKPISVTFSIPQQDIQTVNDAFAKGPLDADALRSDSNKVIESGKLAVIDNQVDSTTGTVKLKADFPNENVQLWPGQFVNVRLLVNTLKGVTVIPTGAVQRGPDGTFVYVVGADDKATMRPITVQKQDESQTVVASGLKPDEKVVTTGFARLTDGATVTVGSDNPAPAAAGAQQGNGQRRQRGGNGSRPAAQQ